MEETGTVVEVRDRIALVSTVAKGACHSCSARGICHLGENQTMVAEAWNSLGAGVGDTVRIRLSSRSVLGAAFLLYGVPLAVFLLGVILGQSLTHHQVWAVVIGLVGMVMAYGGIWILDRRFSKEEKMRPEIVAVITPATSPRPKEHER
jgi:sigma-E factor negative regulatory protein RseC